MRSISLVVLLVSCAACLTLGGCDNNNPIGSSGGQPPSISISPTSSPAGGADLQLTITGSRFYNERHLHSQAVWVADGNETFMATTFVSSTQLVATITAGLLQNPGIVQILVDTFDPMGDPPGQRSSPVSFGIYETPSITSVSPSSATAGSSALTLTVTGSGFVSAESVHSRVTWSYKDDSILLPTTFVSSTQLTAVLSANELSVPRFARVSVQTWADRSGEPQSESNSIEFVVK